MEYSDSNWVPSSQWDGDPGFLLDYNVNSLFSKPKESGSTRNISLNGTSGLNAGLAVTGRLSRELQPQQWRAELVYQYI